jgi:tRNA A-37 threonylcarbamoyl transferase component Bud32
MPEGQTLKLDRWVSSTKDHALKEAKDNWVPRVDQHPMKAKRVCNSCLIHAPAEVAERLRVAEVAEREAAAAAAAPAPEPVLDPAPDPAPAPVPAPVPDPTGRRWAGGMAVPLAGTVVGMDREAELLTKIGKGAAGTVWKAKWLNDKASLIAVKTLKDEFTVEEVEKETEALRQMKGLQGVVQMYDSSTGPQKYIIMEYFNFPDLREYTYYDYEYRGRKNATVELAINIIIKVLTTLKEVHARGYAHLDLKPENILYDADGTHDVKIIDFGLAERCLDDNGDPILLESARGSPFFRALEVWRAGLYNGMKADIYSVGIILYYLIHKHEPEYMATKLISRKGEDERANEFINLLAKNDPEDRPTAGEALIEAEALQQRLSEQQPTSTAAKESSLWTG